MAKTASTNTGALIAAVVLTLIVAGVGGYMIGARAAQPENQVVASVNGENISKTDLYARMEKQVGSDVVTEMIEELLINQAAKAANIAVSSAEVDAEIKQITESIGGEESLKQALAQYNMTMDQLRANRTLDLKVMKIVTKDVKTDDATLKTFFDQNLAQFDKREVQARHILVKTEEEAKAIKAELDSGGDFAAIAKAKSTDTASGANGGDLGFNKRGNMVPEFDQVVFSLKKGEISAPFESQYGWHIAQAVEIKGAVPVFENMKNDVKNAFLRQQASEKRQPWMDDLKANAKINNTLEKKS